MTDPTNRIIAAAVAQAERRIVQLRAVTGLPQQSAIAWLRIINGLGRSSLIPADRLAEEFIRRVTAGENPLDAAAAMAVNLDTRI